MQYRPIDEYTDEQRINFAWSKILEAVDKRDIQLVRKMYHLIQWIQGGKQAYKKSNKDVKNHAQ